VDLAVHDDPSATPAIRTRLRLPGTTRPRFALHGAQRVKLEAQRARFEPAFRNGKAAKVLELLAIEDPSGGDLFKIYELCEGNPGNRPRFHKQFRISLGEFQRFEDVVHNKTVSGDWARHARDESPKTNNPMSQGEAVSFIQRVAYEWLEYIRRA